MKNAKNPIGVHCSPLSKTIYAGRVKHDAEGRGEWVGEKFDVTKEAINAVVQHIGVNCKLELRGEGLPPLNLILIDVDNPPADNKLVEDEEEGTLLPAERPIPDVSVFSYHLDANTGYEAAGEYKGITPEQYGQIVGAMESVMNPEFNRKRFEAWMLKTYCAVIPADTWNEDGTNKGPVVQEKWDIWQQAFAFSYNGE